MARDDAALLDDFLACCPEMLFTLDREGAIVRLSEPLRRLLGPEARAGALLSAQIHSEDRGALEAASAALAGGEAEAGFDARVRGADGEDRAYSFRARRGSANGEIHGSVREARDPAAAKLAEYGRLLRVVLDGLSVIVTEIDPSGVVRFQEGNGLAHAGLSPGQFVGKSLLDIYAGTKSADRVREALAGRPTHTVGEVHDVQWETWFLPVKTDRGALGSLVSFSIDLTAARQAEAELRAKIDLIDRQQRVISALATPIIEVWDKVLTLPVMGVMDSNRAAEVMDNLLQQVSRKGARFALLDLTGVDALDTGTAGHLIKLIQALRLLGAEGVITGIQPAVAQTIVALGVNLADIKTLANLRDGLRYCMKRLAEAGKATASAISDGRSPA